MLKTIDSYEILSHGWDRSDYFQGCGVSGTPFDDVYTGCGVDAVTAYADALESMASGGEYNPDELPKRPPGIRKRDRVPAAALADDCGDVLWRVSVRVKRHEISTGLALLRRLPEGAPLYVVIRSVSRSGMRRVMDVFAVESGDLCRVPVLESECWISSGDRSRRLGGDYVIDGCGMDMAFALVSHLGRLAFPEGFTATTQHHARKPGEHVDGAYRFRHVVL